MSLSKTSASPPRYVDAINTPTVSFPSCDMRPLFCSSCGTYCVGKNYCSNCGTHCVGASAPAGETSVRRKPSTCSSCGELLPGTFAPTSLYQTISQSLPLPQSSDPSVILYHPPVEESLLQHNQRRRIRSRMAGVPHIIQFTVCISLSIIVMAAVVICIYFTT